MSQAQGNLSELVDAAFRKSAGTVIQVAKQTGTPIVVWENDRIKEISVDQYEQSASLRAAEESEHRKDSE